MFLVKHCIIYVNKCGLNFVTALTIFLFQNIWNQNRLKNPFPQGKIITNVLEIAKAKNSGSCNSCQIWLGNGRTDSLQACLGRVQLASAELFLFVSINNRSEISWRGNNLCKNHFFVKSFFMREPNYCALPDVARQADVTPNFRCMKDAFNY